MRTYVDSGVLITAARGNAALSAPAIEILSDATREFVSSDWVKLEVLPKAQYFRQTSEVQFYNLFFGRVSVWALFGSDVLSVALQEASATGMSGADAIHVVLAARCGCAEFVTSERATSAIHRTARLRVVSIRPRETPETVVGRLLRCFRLRRARNV